MKRKEYIDLGVYVERAKKGDAEAFEYLYQLTHKRIYYLVYTALDNKADVEDKVQEIYLKAYKALPDLKDNTTFMGWLNKIAYHVCSRQKEMPWLVAEPADLMRLESDDEAVYSGVLQEERNDIWINCLKKLSDNQRTALTMRLSFDLKYSEIAEAMDCSEEKVKHYIKNAKRRLKEIIKALPEYEKELLRPRSVGVLTFMQMYKWLVKSSTSSTTVRYASATLKIVGGLSAAVAVGAIGVGILLYPGADKPVVLPEQENISVKQEAVVVDNQEQPLTPEGEPVILSHEVSGDYLVIEVTNQADINLNKSYGITAKGRKIKPTAVDELSHRLYFSAYEESFDLYLENTQGDAEVFELVRVR